MFQYMTTQYYIEMVILKRELAEISLEDFSGISIILVLLWIKVARIVLYCRGIGKRLLESALWCHLKQMLRAAIEKICMVVKILP
jgi:hypothetical protein